MEATQPQNSNSLFNPVVRLIGITVMIFGLYISGKVAFEAWNLYDKPESIQKWQKIVEKETQMDAALNSKMDAALQQNNKPVNKKIIKFSYFVSWFIVVLMLLIISRIGLWTLREGAKLALFNNIDTQQFARAIVEEIYNRKVNHI